MKKLTFAFVVFLLIVSAQPSIAKSSTPPQVRIQKLSDTIYRLSWPVSDFVILSWSPDLVSYYPLASTLQVVGNNYVTNVVVEPGTLQAFFKLTAVE